MQRNNSVPVFNVEEWSKFTPPKPDDTMDGPHKQIKNYKNS